MKDSSLLERFEDISGEAPTSRRKALRTAGKLGAGLAFFSLPAFMRPSVSFAQSGNQIVDVLNYALTLEYLEKYYYQEAITFHEDLFPAGELGIFQLITQHETDHVAFLRSVIQDLGFDPVTLQRDDFDYTAGGAYTPFDDYATFLLLSQAFEDTGVSAYKGQAANLIENDVVLTAALQIHSLEARHAAEVRYLREANGFFTGITPWIVLDNSSGAPQPIYYNEANVTQLGIDITTLGYSQKAASAAFDEPLTKQEVVSIVDPFSSEIPA